METKKSSRGGLHRLFLTTTILPLIILGIFIVGIGYVMYMHGLQTEVHNGLGAVARTVLATYDTRYEGDFNLLTDEKNGKVYLRKGDTIISDDLSLIDDIKKETGIDITIFFYNMRMMTTITDEAGQRVDLTVAHETVVRKVLEEGEPTFYARVLVGGRSYFAEYVPFFSESGVCLGMIGTAKPSAEVASMVNNAVFFNTMIIVAGILLVVFIIRRTTNSIVWVLGKMKKFLGDISDGNLGTQLDDVVFSRQDEIGDMARFTVHLQGSLRKLIERDALTGIYNRRSGAMKMWRVIDDGLPYAVAMGDIDFFKKVNDTYGHDAGDEVLRVVSRVLTDHMRTHGFAARWGGEEFLLIFENTDLSAATAVLWDILNELRGTVITCGEFNINVTMSMGIVTGEPHGDLDVQLKRADEGLYYAKTHGRNQVIEADVLPTEEESAPEEKSAGSGVSHENSEAGEGAEDHGADEENGDGSAQTEEEKESSSGKKSRIRTRKRKN